MSATIRHVTCEEFLQPSALRSYRWPASEPVLVNQTTRTVTGSDVELVRQSGSCIAFDLGQLNRNTSGETLSGRIAYMLTHQKLNFNPTGAVRQEEIWVRRIARAMEREEPIDVTYPLMCVQGNWAKRMTNIGPHAGEDCTFFFFSHLNDLVRQIYAPGLRFHLFCDARLYNSAFQISEVEVTHYVRSITDRILELGLAHTIHIEDYTTALERHALRDYMCLYQEYNQRLAHGDATILEGVNVAGLYESVRATVNTRRLGMSYADHRAIFGPQTDGVPHSSRFTEMITAMTDIAFREVIATRKACAAVDVPNRVYPHALRVTCHKEQKNGVWHIGLRCYPEYYGASKLLPYHGVPLIHRGKNGLPRLEIHPEVCLRGVHSFVRVVKPTRYEDEVYFYDATHLEPNTATALIGSCEA